MAEQMTRVVVSGLRELNKALAAGNQEAGDAMKAAFKQIAAGVIEDVKSRVPHLTGAAAASYKPRGGVKGAGIAFGSARAPYVAYLEFGNKPRYQAGVGRLDSNPRPFVKGGRYLYPAITANMASVEEKVSEALTQVLSKYGYSVEEG